MNRPNWKRIGIGVLLGFMAFILVVSLYILRMDFMWSHSRFTKEIEKHSQGGQVIYAESGDMEVRGVETGDPEAQPMVFIHGAPGSGRDFSRYLFHDSLQAVARLIALDRPGYGGSDYGNPMPSVIEQADRLSVLVPDSSILIGHSFGGPVASALAIRHPQKVAHLVLLAAAVDPDQEKHFLINDIIGRPPLKWILSGAVRVAVKEKMTHEQALEELKPYWPKLDVPVTVVHGRNDNIVPYENVAFLESQLEHLDVTYHAPDGMNHIMIWSMDDWVTDQLLEILDR